jgi:hypothetical protein
MKRIDWVHEIAKDCQFSIPVCGGAMCGEGIRREYCEFKRCPRIELEKKEER